MKRLFMQSIAFVLTYDTVKVLLSTLTEIIQSNSGGKKDRHDLIAFCLSISVDSVHV